jgi:hypothetical protein
MLLKRWSPLFDASRERIDELPIWVCLPGLPVELWTQKGFECLGNALGRYMDADMSFTSTGKMSMARILVSLNIHKGLAGEIELSWGDRSILQKLDYEGIPFKCRWCHKHGHNASEFHLPMRGKKDKGSAGSAQKKRGASQLGDAHSAPTSKLGRVGQGLQ